MRTPSDDAAGVGPVGPDRAPRRPSHRGPRRAVAMAVGLLVVVATLGLAAGPASAAVPGAPRLFAVTGYSTGIRVYFAPPISDGGAPIQHYTITRFPFCPTLCPVIPTTFTQTTSAMFEDTSATSGDEFTYKVTATNADGTSAASAVMSATRTATFTDYNKFTNKQAFVARQYETFLGREPNATELATEVSRLAFGTDTPASFMQTLINDASREPRRQVTRLYFAYFQRGPDHGGLTFWSTRITAHTKTINDVSQDFASSHEFQTTYGSLANVDFVTLVYHNVLDRDPDTTGLAFWTDQLDQHLVTRGRVMTQFSESHEFKTASVGKVDAAEVWDAMLGTNISTADLALFGDHIQGGGSIGSIATEIMTEGAYH